MPESLTRREIRERWEANWGEWVNLVKELVFNQSLGEELAIKTPATPELREEVRNLLPGITEKAAFKHFEFLNGIAVGGARALLDVAFEETDPILEELQA